MKYNHFVKIEPATAIMQIKSWDEKPFGEVWGAPKLTKSSGLISYQGEVEGEGILEGLRIHNTDSYVTILYGLERFNGRIRDKAGSFVFERNGKFENGIGTLELVVVPGSGTGNLKGLRGEVDFVSGHARKFLITLDYYFE